MSEIPGATWQGTDVDAMMIERQLARLWQELVRETPEAHAHAVRTSIYNLIVHTENEQDARRIADSLAELSHRRPSRAIILIGDRFHTKSRVDADLCVQCRTVVGGRPLCHEQMLVTARGRAADHLTNLSIPLLVPGLPTYLWWPGQPPFGHRVFHRLLGVGDQLIIDSAEFASPGDGLADVARVCSGTQGVRDFNWARLAPWRDIIAQFFDASAYRPYVDGIRSLRVEFGAGDGDLHRATAGTLLLLGWAGSLLGWEPETPLDTVLRRDVQLSVLQGERLITIDVQFREHGPEMASRLCGVELVSQPKGLPPARFLVERTDDLEHARVSVQVHEGSDIARVVPLALKDEAELLADELDLAGQDPLYARTVDMASRMAGREVWVPA